MSLLLLGGSPGGVVNLVTDDDSHFDGGTIGNWSDRGANTLTASTTEARSPAYSGKIVYQDEVAMMRMATTVTAAGIYLVSAYVWIPADWDGGALKIELVSFTGSSKGAQVTTTDTGAWTLVSTYHTLVAGDLTGAIDVITASAPTAGKFIYVDDVSLVAQ